MSGPSVGALFAGYGGIELALHDVLDARPAWVSEIEAAPSRVLAHHWADVPNLGDVTAVDWSRFEPVDILTGGSPCQDLSHAGKRAGMRAGTRSGLWASMCDAIDALRPSLVVWENVRGALSAPADSAVEPCPICVGDRPRVTLRALGRVLGDLAELGYDAAWTSLRAADVGAPHGRFRVFVTAWPTSDPAALTWPTSDPAALLPTPAVNDMGRAYSPDEWDEWTDRMRAEHGNGNGHGKSLHVEALRLLPTPVADNSRGLPQRGTDYQSLPNAVAALLPTPRATDGTKGGPNQRGSAGDLMLPSAVTLLPTPTTTQRGTDANLDTREGARANLHNEVVGSDRWGQYAPAIARWEALTRPAPAPTEPTGKGGAHRLSPRFVEWMMGLPDGWVTDVPGVSRNEALKALGNGVVPQQAAAATRRLLTIRAAAIEAGVAA